MFYQNFERPLKAILVLLCLCFELGSMGCQATTQRPDDDVTQKSRDELLFDYRVVTRELSASKWAPEVSRDLDLARVWLGRAERLLDEERPDTERVDLLLLALDGQLVRIKTYYARRAEEDELEQTRLRYEQRSKLIDTARKDNDARLERGEQEKPR